MTTFNDHSDALRAHTDFRRYLAVNFDGLTAGWIGDRLGRYGVDAAAPSYLAFQHMIEDTVNADTCWMTHEMMDLVQHAMNDFEITEPFDLEDAFIPHGFMVLPEAFLSIDINDKIIAHRAILWRLDEFGCVFLEDNRAEGGELVYTFDLNRAADGIVEPVLRITTVSHVGDEDDFSGADPEMIEQLKANGIMWGIAHATTIPLALMSSINDVKGEGDKHAGWLRFWRVAQKLMAETIITSERRPAARPARREAMRQGLDVGAPRVIELRRPQSHEADPEGERVRDVQWTHRWINRGHWRQQWYASQGRHKQIWIGAYIKGPQNLPLVVRERVWNWDR